MVMQIKRIIRRGAKNTRVELEDGTESVIPTEKLNVGDTPTLAVVPASNEPPSPTLTVQQRFENMERLVNTVISGPQPSVIICGDAGIGKTFLVRQQLQKAGLKEQVVTADEPAKKDDKKKKQQTIWTRTKTGDYQPADYIFVKGYSSPMGLYQVLHDNRQAIIVFDDCDSVFKTPVSVNVLKSALDSYDTRIVSWMSTATEKMGLESRFEFKGKIIFISNLPEQSLDEAVRSRSFAVEIRLSRKEIWDRMRELVPHIEPKVDMGLKDEVINFIGFHVDKFTEFNMRTFIKAIRIRQSNPDHWKEMVLKFA